MIESSALLRHALAVVALFLGCPAGFAQQRSIVPDPPVGWTYGGVAAPLPAFATRAASTAAGAVGVVSLAKTAATAGYLTGGAVIVVIDQINYPKFKMDGHNIRAHWMTNDFNSPSRILQYRNYLPPLPATHPPVSEPGVLYGQQRLSHQAAGTVRIEY
jgi:hypothetical protein